MFPGSLRLQFSFMLPTFFRLFLFVFTISSVIVFTVKLNWRLVIMKMVVS